MNPFWGPLYLAFDVVPENQIIGWVLTLILAPAILVFPLRPRMWSGTVAMFGLIGWLVAGFLGAGISV